MLRETFDLLGPYWDTVQLKDYYLEDRLVLHVSETVIGTGLMDFETDPDAGPTGTSRTATSSSSTCR